MDTLPLTVQEVVLGGGGGRRSCWGLTGALIGMGIPECEVKRYEGKIKRRNLLLSVHIEDGNQRDRAKKILEAGGADHFLHRRGFGSYRSTEFYLQLIRRPGSGRKNLYFLAFPYVRRGSAYARHLNVANFEPCALLGRASSTGGTTSVKIIDAEQLQRNQLRPSRQSLVHGSAIRLMERA